MYVHEFVLFTFLINCISLLIAGSTSVAPTEDLIVEELPPRLFALDRYPVKTKMNAHSKPEYFSDIAQVLKGK